MIPYLDLKAQYHSIKNEIDTAVLRVLDSTQYILGDEVAAFEREFAGYCQASQAIGGAWAQPSAVTFGRSRAR